jgi:quinol monooxygenase YgiN
MSDVLEIARVRVNPDSGDDLEKGMASAVTALSAAPGCRGAQAYRCIEVPDTFVLLVTWKAVEDHENFRASDQFGDYRANISSFLAEAPEFAHYSLVAADG